LTDETKTISNSNTINSSSPNNSISEFSYSNQTLKSIYNFQKLLKLFKENKIKFWEDEAVKLFWIKFPEKIRTGKGINSNWLIGSKSNITINCIDRHLTSDNKNKAAIIWESEPGKNWILTYQLLYSYVCRTANAIKKLGIKKGDKVCIVCGSLPESIFSALACSRIGVTFTILNPLNSINLLSRKIQLGNFNLIILADSIYRKGIVIDIKNKIDSALDIFSSNIKKLIFRRIKSNEIRLLPEQDYLFTDLIENISDDCKPVQCDNKFPLFTFFDYDENGNLQEKYFLAAGFMLQTFTSSKYAFDFNSDDIFWCNIDFSSSAGVAYGIFAPLLHGISAFVYEGLPGYPTKERFWKLIKNYKITKLLTEDYIIKALLELDDKINTDDLSSLKFISVTGNPLTENDWKRIFSEACNEKIPLLNCFIPLEFGTILFSDIPGITEINPGYFNPDFPSTEFNLIDFEKEILSDEAGQVSFSDSFPILDKNQIKNKAIVIKRNKFFLTDYKATRIDNKIKIINRTNEKLLITGELISKKEIKSVIEEHPKVKSCKVEDKSDLVLYLVPVAFVELKDKQDGTLLFKEELRNLVEQKISLAAKPIDIIFID
jgi:acetyl-CoA synthetase